MFGALNRFIGRLDGEPAQQSRAGPSDNAFGFQVLRNQDRDIPLEPWFDFIVGINGHAIVRGCWTFCIDWMRWLILMYRRILIQTSLRRRSAIALAQV